MHVLSPGEIAEIDAALAHLHSLDDQALIGSIAPRAAVQPGPVGPTRSTMADRRGSGARLASYRDGALLTTKFAGKGHCEPHLTGDELIHILDGTATLQFVCEDGP